MSVDQDENEITISWRPIWFSSVIPIVFMTGIVAVLLYNMLFHAVLNGVDQFIKNPSLGLFFILLLIAIAISCLVFVLLYLWFYKERTVLNPNGWNKDWSILLLRHYDSFPLEKITGFDVSFSRGRRGQMYYFFRVLTSEKPIRFGINSNKNEMDRICKQLNDFLNELKREQNY